MDLGTLGGLNSGAGAVNDLGQVTGESDVIISGATVTHAFFWDHGTMSDLQTLGGDTTYGFAINNQGQVTGQSDVTTVPDPTFGIPSFHGFFWYNGKLVDLGPIFGGNFNYGQDINENVIVGAADLAGDLAAHGFVWQNGVVTDLGTFPGDNSSAALGINDFGAIVGISGQSPTDFFEPPSEEFNCPCHAALWMNGQVVDLNTLIPGNSGWQLTIAMAINDRGQIIGEGTFNNLPRSFLLTPVPGPASGSPASTSSAPISAETPSPAAVPSTVTRVIIQRRTVQLITQPQ
jgi:probable HAF family extracellular repeat protein